ncbi:hypothetical protein PsorP6_015728 [Peronosclerospora sorghi]|uniref:Uncharacterized protein n=1 Tax=Peronosclerospora sorghi TaxID=230839 RepID=A0ACC0WNP2_9STRA|nr:hypothetical protein PsorP6_015728 [Peronosclerospora sorghi]
MACTIQYHLSRVNEATALHRPSPSVHTVNSLTSQHATFILVHRSSKARDLLVSHNPQFLTHARDKMLIMGHNDDPTFKLS